MTSPVMSLFRWRCTFVQDFVGSVFRVSVKRRDRAPVLNLVQTALHRCGSFS